MNLADFRKEYSARGLRRNDLHHDAIAQFDSWFKQSVELEIHEPNAMSLATVDENLCPLLRTVLLKFYDAKGFVFYTNYESRKARHIAQNPHVSLLFPWLTLERQIIITGKAEKVSTAESLKYFASRPRESQLGAWVSQQSSVVSSRKLLLMKLAELREKFTHGEIPLPSFWGGFRVVPKTIEFWQGGPGRVHDRFLYTKDEDTWKIERLSP